MLQRRAGTTWATSVACAFRLTGEVTLTSRAAVAAVCAANSEAAKTSAPTADARGINRFTVYCF
jgi:hypothetical protein